MNQFKKIHEEINSVKLAIDKYEAVKARDIKQFVEISRFARLDTSENGEQLIAICDRDKIWFFVPTSLEQVCSKVAEEEGIDITEVKLPDEGLRVKFNKIDISNGRTYIETIIDWERRSRWKAAYFYYEKTYKESMLGWSYGIQ